MEGTAAAPTVLRGAAAFAGHVGRGRSQALQMCPPALGTPPLTLTWEAGTAAAFREAAVPRGSSLPSSGGLPPVLARLRPEKAAEARWGGSPLHS